MLEIILRIIIRIIVEDHNSSKDMQLVYCTRSTCYFFTWQTGFLRCLASPRKIVFLCSVTTFKRQALEGYTVCSRMVISPPIQRSKTWTKSPWTLRIPRSQGKEYIRGLNHDPASFRYCFLVAFGLEKERLGHKFGVPIFILLFKSPRYVARAMGISQPS